MSAREGLNSREEDPSGSHKPVKCKVVGTVNICESAIKVVIHIKRKWLLRLSQNGNGGGISDDILRCS